MKKSFALCLAVWAGATAGCSSSTEQNNREPDGFVFQTDEGSLASFGWSGAVHAVETAPGTPFEVKTTACAGDVCRFEGPVDFGDKVNRRRCLYRMSETCTMDSDCPLDPRNGTPTACVYIYDTPIAAPLPSDDNTQIGACAWTYFPLAPSDGQPAISGTLNLVTGALKLESFTLRLPQNAIGPGAYAGVCAECIGDTTANDGVKEGRCKLAAHLGQPPGPNAPTPIADPSIDLGVPCDVNRTGTIGGYDGSYSMDCSPTLAPGAGEGLDAGGSFSSSGIEISLSQASPDCKDPAWAGKCFCGMCEGEMTATACMSSKDCPGGGRCLGTSLPDDPLNKNALAARGNLCADKTCNWDEKKGTGTCKNAAMQSISCYPGDVGSGNPVSISAPGFAEPDPQISTLYHAGTASASCIPAGSSDDSRALNAKLGLPGLLFQKRNFQITLHYAEDQK